MCVCASASACAKHRLQKEAKTSHPCSATNVCAAADPAGGAGSQSARQTAASLLRVGRGQRGLPPWLRLCVAHSTHNNAIAENRRQPPFPHASTAHGHTPDILEREIGCPALLQLEEGALGIDSSSCSNLSSTARRTAERAACGPCTGPATAYKAFERCGASRQLHGGVRG